MTRWQRTPGGFDGSDLDEGALRGPTLIDWMRIAIASCRRRKLLVTFAFLASFCAFAAFWAMKTPTYRVETRVLTLDRLALPSAARSVYEDVPSRSAYELVHRRDNLVVLLRQARLIPEEVDATGVENADRANAAERLNALVAMLDKRLDVTADQGAITIAVEWDDPHLAYALARSALDNFLEARHVQEVSSIDEVISVLEGHAAKLRQELEAATESARHQTTSQRRPAAPVIRQPSQELVRLESLLAAKQRALADVEEFRRRRVADLQAQLDQARNTLSDAHPTVIGLRKDIEAASHDSPQITAIRQEEQEARARYIERRVREGVGPNAAVSAVPQIIPSAPSEEDPRVRQAQAQYDQMAARLNAARVEFDAAQAAFKYRYRVVWPPQVPDVPVSPNATKIFGVGLLASLVVALVAAVAPDFFTRRIVHRVQVERSLGLEVIGEVDSR